MKSVEATVPRIKVGRAISLRSGSTSDLGFGKFGSDELAKSEDHEHLESQEAILD